MVDAAQEAYEEYKKEQTDPTKKIQRSFSRKQIIILGIISAIGIYLIFIQKIFEPKEGILILAVALAVIYLIMTKDDSESKIVLMREAMAIVHQETNYMQNVTKQIPLGVVRIAPIAKLFHIEGNPVKWKVGLEVETQRGNHSQHIAEVEPYEGYIMGVYPAKTGLSEVKKQDTRYVLPKEIDWRNRYNLEEHDYKPRR